LTARIQDRSIRTKGEALAATLVENAGIVIPECALTPSSNGGLMLADGGVSPALGQALRTALVDQLLTQDEIQNNLLPINLASSRRNAFESAVAQIADPELVFGFERAFRTYRLLTNTANASSSTCGPVTLGTAGLVSAPPGAVADSVTNLRGVVVAGGIGRSRLTTDPIARTAGMLEASQGWDNYGGAWHLVNNGGNGIGCVVGPCQWALLAPWSEWGTLAFDPTKFGTGATDYDLLNLPQGLFASGFHMGTRRS
jgi:hypothetical protein